MMVSFERRLVLETALQLDGSWDWRLAWLNDGNFPLWSFLNSWNFIKIDACTSKLYHFCTWVEWAELYSLTSEIWAWYNLWIISEQALSQKFSFIQLNPVSAALVCRLTVPLRFKTSLANHFIEAERIDSVSLKVLMMVWEALFVRMFISQLLTLHLGMGVALTIARNCLRKRRGNDMLPSTKSLYI
jgi:hypothetical protein